MPTLDFEMSKKMLELEMQPPLFWRYKLRGLECELFEMKLAGIKKNDFARKTIEIEINKIKRQVSMLAVSSYLNQII